MEFNTIDGFQGREVDILILSTVRSSDSIGFVADIRRMNVALTRARLSLWILGNERTLQKNCDWAALLKDARKRNLVISVKRPYKSISENILGNTPDTNCSGDYSGTPVEAAKKSKHVLEIESNYESCRRKSKYKEMKHGRVKSSASEGLETAKRKVDTTEKCQKLAERQQTSEGMHKTVKKIKNRSVFDQSEQDVNGIDKISNPVGSKGVEKSVRHFKNEEDKDGPRSHVNCKVKGKDVDGGGKLSSEIERPKDTISKRKQQREAVDALLSSALLPSKNSETSNRAMAPKRPHSPSSTGGVSKPTKQQRGLQAEQGQNNSRIVDSFSSRKKK